MSSALKTLGLLLLASLALGASAIAAQASENAKFTAASYPNELHGEDNGTHVFTAAGGEANCGSATFTGTSTAASTTQTINASYGGPCSAYGFIGATITMNGCDYLFHLSSTGAGGAYKGTADLVCSEGKEVTIDAGPCTVHIPGQNGLGSVTYTNGSSGGVNEVTVNANLTGIHGTLTKSNFLCFFTTGTFTNGTYTGTITLLGTANQHYQSIDIG